jgi:hypothetical protein
MRNDNPMRPGGLYYTAQTRSRIGRDRAPTPRTDAAHRRRAPTAAHRHRAPTRASNTAHRTQRIEHSASTSRIGREWVSEQTRPKATS